MMEQELWLGREKHSGGFYGIFTREPIPFEMEEIFGRLSLENINDGEKGVVDYFCPEIFHLIVQGARLRKGRKKRIKRILIELED